MKWTNSDSCCNPPPPPPKKKKKKYWNVCGRMRRHTYITQKHMNYVRTRSNAHVYTGTHTHTHKWAPVPATRAQNPWVYVPSVFSWALTSLHSDVSERSRLTPAGANVHDECLLSWPKSSSSSSSWSLVMLLLVVELGWMGLCLLLLSLKSWLSHSVSLDEALEGLSSRCRGKG